MSKVSQTLAKFETNVKEYKYEYEYKSKKSKMPRNNRAKILAPSFIESYRDQKYGKADVNMLMAILETRRPHGTKSERKFSVKFLDCINGMETDSIGNRILTIPGDGDNIAYSSHVDTVHTTGGVQGIQAKHDIVTLSDKSRSNCLGADDGAGVWLMLELIRAKKPGLYLFHRGEECGGVGSMYIATKTPQILDNIDAVIALDRFGYDSVITHQGDITASREFAESLAAALPAIDCLRADDTGLFTDSANYEGIVKECTNLSVGYFGHHSAGENQDIAYLCAMRESLINMDSSTLIFSRYPGESEYDSISIDYDRGEASMDSWSNSYKQWESMVQNDSSDFIRAIRDHPAIAADIMSEYGIGEDELLQRIYDESGEVRF